MVRSLEKTDGAAEKFAETGYEYCGEFGIAGRRYLRKGGDERTHQIHIFQADDWGNIGRHLAFRDYMRTHEKERNQYAKMKKALAQKFPWDIDGYCDGKENFVREMEALALSEYDGSWDRLYISAGNVQCERTISPTIEAGSVSADGNVVMPCGSCRELMMQMDENAGEIEVLRDYQAKKTARLKTLLPDWWR